MTGVAVQYVEVDAQQVQIKQRHEPRVVQEALEADYLAQARALQGLACASRPVPPPSHGDCEASSSSRHISSTDIPPCLGRVLLQASFHVLRCCICSMTTPMVLQLHMLATVQTRWRPAAGEVKVRPAVAGLRRAHEDDGGVAGRRQREEDQEAVQHDPVHSKSCATPAQTVSDVLSGLLRL